jgi:tetratricopeptide (TPR) repeat protein
MVLMTKEPSISRKDMKAPDRFQEASGKALEWASSKRRPILVGSVITVSLVVAATAGAALTDRRQEKAGLLLYKVLDAADGEISSVPIPGTPGPYFKDEDERQKAIVAAAEETRSKYPGSNAARTATLALANARYQLGEHEAALTAYEAFLRDAPKTDSLRFAAHDGIAHVHEAKGELEKAAARYQEMGQEASGFKDRAALEQARVLAQAGKHEEARAILKSFPEDFKESMLKATAQERLGRLPAAPAEAKPAPAPEPTPAPETQNAGTKPTTPVEGAGK